ncbi:MAG: ATP-grasp domain-containing protein [Actinomycetia bacterium]|nr:ATP-grasp domain-containing protein [Actinomycetes bacterium]
MWSGCRCRSATTTQSREGRVSVSSDNEASSGGASQITRLLVANRGEIARRVFRSARDMGIETVAVYADGDADAPFVAEADQAVALYGRSPAESYLDVDKVLAAAARTGADAIHPGYGFLSENADFARACEAAGLIWVGPPPDAVAAMGDKLEAKKMMIEAGVPTLASVEITDVTDVTAEADTIGYPVLIKAAAGGGGKGMRIVASAAELTAAIAGAQREAAGAFGDDTVFIEKYLGSPRHVEIQILGDQHGNLIHCFERECSIQRRHQKIIEEAPSPVLTEAVRQRMGDAAVAAGAALGYYSAGTVEFLLDEGPSGDWGDDAGFFFLEVNTRLQVEHPVTEEVTGLDLVRQQLRVAMGEPLGFGQDDLAISGHAIEARLYAEDPANDFLPATGLLASFELPSSPSARLDSGVVSGSTVGVDFDPMLAKVIVHAPTRREAALRLALVLEKAVVAGVTTNRDFLVSTLRHEAFLAGDTTTDFIDRVSPATRFEPTDEQVAQAAVAATLFRQHLNRQSAGTLAFMPAAYRNSSMPDEEIRFSRGDDQPEVAVLYAAQRDGSMQARIRVGDTEPGPPMAARTLGVDTSGPFAITVDIDGLRSTSAVSGWGSTWHVNIGAGAVELTELSPFPDTGGGDVAGGQAAPMPGKILVVEVEVGAEVTTGQTLLIMEAMKMEHTIVAPGDGVVTEVRCAVDDQVDNGQVLVVLEAT